MCPAATDPDPALAVRREEHFLVRARPVGSGPVSGDPTQTDPDKYKVVFENERVRVLEYRDKPGDRTSPHRHPDTVMYTLSAFERRLIRGDQQRDVQLDAGRVNWLAAQEHSGENIGTTDSHALFVEVAARPMFR